MVRCQVIHTGISVCSVGVYGCSFGCPASLTVKDGCRTTKPRRVDKPTHNFPSTSGCEIVGDATTAGCRQVIHTDISACSTFLLWCTAVGLDALLPRRLKTGAGQRSRTVWATPQIFGGGSHASELGHQSAGFGHLQRRHVGWTAMTHHERNCGSLVHLQKLHFQFGGVVTSTPLSGETFGLIGQNPSVSKSNPLHVVIF